MVRIQCVVCERMRLANQLRDDGYCVYCERAFSCTQCGRLLRRARSLPRHQSGRDCAERGVEHVLWVAGWVRCGTLSRTLRKRGFEVRYAPRWIAEGHAPMETPVTHHPKLWKQPDADVPPPPPWPTAAFEDAQGAPHSSLGAVDARWLLNPDAL